MLFRSDNDNLYLEEYPAFKKNTVLNGWIFALFGIYDLFLSTSDKIYMNVFNQSFSTLIKDLEIYDAGFWSYYDERRALASPFYHNLHISQLDALSLVTGDESVKNRIRKWKDYKRNLIRRNYALILKAYQKIKNPDRVIVIK